MDESGAASGLNAIISYHTGLVPMTGCRPGLGPEENGGVSPEPQSCAESTFAFEKGSGSGRTDCPLYPSPQKMRQPRECHSKKKIHYSLLKTRSDGRQWCMVGTGGPQGLPFSVAFCLDSFSFRKSEPQRWVTLAST